MTGTITALRVQKRKDERVNVFLDGQYAFPLSAILAARLRLGQHLSDDEIAALKAADDAELAYGRAVRFLAYRPRSVAEVQRYLERHGAPEEVIASVIRRLSGAGYLNDADFVQFWVRDRERFKPRSPQALRQELRNKGVSSQTVEQALRSLDSEDSAYRAAAERARRLEHLDERTFRQKLGAYLLRRGFSHAVVWPVVGRVWRELRHDKVGEDDAGWLDGSLD